MKPPVPTPARILQFRNLNRNLRDKPPQHNTIDGRVYHRHEIYDRRNRHTSHKRKQVLDTMKRSKEIKSKEKKTRLKSQKNISTKQNKNQKEIYLITDACLGY